MSILIPNLSPGDRLQIKDHTYELIKLNHHEDTRLVPFLILKRVPDLNFDEVLDPLDFFTCFGHLYQVKDTGKSLLCHGFLSATHETAR